MSYSNCMVFAWREYWRRYDLWVDAGMPRHQRPRLVGVPSRSAPHEVIHWQVWGWTDPPLEFVPVQRRDVSWWMAWTRLFFQGRIRPADFPATEPSQHGQLDALPPPQAKG